MPRKTATFGAQLAAHRDRLGLSLAELADRIHADLAAFGLGWLTRTRLSDWERGDRVPNAMTQRVLLDWLAKQRRA